jgi:hypothetical protein
MFTEYTAGFLQVEEALPLYGVFARNVYKVYFGVANVISASLLCAMLFGKARNGKVARVAVVSLCAWLGAVAFVPLGISSDLWKSRIWWHLPFPVALSCVAGLALFYKRFNGRIRTRGIGRISRYIAVAVILLGLFSSSLLAFETNYYTLYYQSPREIRLGAWVAQHSDNRTTVAVANDYLVVEYYAALYHKDLGVRPIGLGYELTAAQLFYQLRGVDIILYTYHMPYVLQIQHNLPPSVFPVDHRDLITSDGSNVVYLSLTRNSEDHA